MYLQGPLHLTIHYVERTCYEYKKHHGTMSKISSYKQQMLWNDRLNNRCKVNKKIFNSFVFLGKRLWRSTQPVVGHVGKPGIIFAALENDYIYSGMAQKLKICW